MPTIALGRIEPTKILSGSTRLTIGITAALMVGASAEGVAFLLRRLSPYRTISYLITEHTALKLATILTTFFGVQGIKNGINTIKSGLNPQATPTHSDLKTLYKQSKHALRYMQTAIEEFKHEQEELLLVQERLIEPFQYDLYVEDKEAQENVKTHYKEILKINKLLTKYLISSHQSNRPAAINTQELLVLLQSSISSFDKELEKETARIQQTKQQLKDAELTPEPFDVPRISRNRMLSITSNSSIGISTLLSSRSVDSSVMTDPETVWAEIPSSIQEEVKQVQGPIAQMASTQGLAEEQRKQIAVREHGRLVKAQFKALNLLDAMDCESLELIVRAAIEDSINIANFETLITNKLTESYWKEKEELLKRISKEIGYTDFEKLIKGYIQWKGDTHLNEPAYSDEDNVYPQENERQMAIDIGLKNIGQKHVGIKEIKEKYSKYEAIIKPIFEINRARTEERFILMKEEIQAALSEGDQFLVVKQLLLQTKDLGETQNVAAEPLGVQLQRLQQQFISSCTTQNDEEFNVLDQPLMFTDNFGVTDEATTINPSVTLKQTRSAVSPTVII